MDKVGGYILLHKQIMENCLWSDKPFARGQAWIDLLLMANFKDGQILCKGVVIKVKRGQVFRTVRFLSERWGWSDKKTKSFLKMLETQKMVSTKGLPQGTLITIEKYGSFQNGGITEEPSEELTSTQPRPNLDLTSTYKRNKNKEERKKNNKEKDIYSHSIEEIVAYLNEMCGTNYKPTSKKTRDLIQARMNEGFTVEDFKTVIYKKGKQWINDPKMCKFLRPETLFSNKFEGYLNEKGSPNDRTRWEVEF